MKKPDERLRGVSIEGPCACGAGGEPTCVGAYEGGPVSLGCDGCCGHGNEDGWCVVLADERHARELAQARAEGFRAAKERAADVAVAPGWKTRTLPEVSEMIRAMEDAGEGGDDTGLHCGECSHMRHSGPCPENCTCDMAETSGEPPLSQLRAATERMEAAAQPTPAVMLGEAMELLARVVQLAQMGGASGLLVSSCQLALHNMRVEKREAEAREGQG